MGHVAYVKGRERLGLPESSEPFAAKSMAMAMNLDEWNDQKEKGCCQSDDRPKGVRHAKKKRRR